MNNPPPYIPSPEEIAAAAAEIRAGWTERERNLRIHPRERRRRWTLPTASERELFEGDAR